MSRKEKLIARFEKVPADFTWKELCSLLNGFGYEMQPGAGSRRKFYKRTTGHLISLHEPHPCPVVKKYALRQVLETLREQGDL